MFVFEKFEGVESGFLRVLTVLARGRATSTPRLSRGRDWFCAENRCGEGCFIPLDVLFVG
jgi:hypothetical protein